MATYGGVDESKHCHLYTANFTKNHNWVGETQSITGCFFNAQSPAYVIVRTKRLVERPPMRYTFLEFKSGYQNPSLFDVPKGCPLLDSAERIGHRKLPESSETARPPLMGLFRVKM